MVQVYDIIRLYQYNKSVAWVGLISGRECADDCFGACSSGKSHARFLSCSVPIAVRIEFQVDLVWYGPCFGLDDGSGTGHHECSHTLFFLAAYGKRLDCGDCAPVSLDVFLGEEKPIFQLSSMFSFSISFCFFFFFFFLFFSFLGSRSNHRHGTSAVRTPCFSIGVSAQGVEPGCLMYLMLFAIPPCDVSGSNGFSGECRNILHPTWCMTRICLEPIGLC